MKFDLQRPPAIEFTCEPRNKPKQFRIVDTSVAESKDGGFEEDSFEDTSSDDDDTDDESVDDHSDEYDNEKYEEGATNEEGYAEGYSEPTAASEFSSRSTLLEDDSVQGANHNFIENHPEGFLTHRILMPQTLRPIDPLKTRVFKTFQIKAGILLLSRHCLIPTMMTRRKLTLSTD